MASTALIEGHYVTHLYKEWDAFEDQKGEAVKAGRSLKVWVYTPHDRDLCEIRVTRDNLDQVLQAVKPLDFGVQVTANCGDKTYGAYKGYSVERALAPAGKP